ncbi:MAG TPA: hypothetical protein VLG27_00020 [Candidatus Saccharimonadia bacterium]|nr:hypothetical protein [Candidatus Saccharimonadia bacterium]
MFGQKDDNSADQGVPGEGTPTNEGPGGHPPIASAATDPMASLSDNAAWQHPGTPLDQTNDTPGAPEPPKEVFSPAGGFPSTASDRITPGGDAPADDAQVTQAADDLVTGSDVDNGDLVEIKGKVLNELAPLVDQLDQPPEEKYRTIMMLLQASDDQRLVEKAYEAAHSIEDEKVRAQALLDIVNEINYFTQQPGSQPPAESS